MVKPALSNIAELAVPFVHPAPEGVHAWARDDKQAVVKIDAKVLYALARRAKLHDNGSLRDWERNAAEGPERDAKIVEHLANLDQSTDFCLFLHDLIP